MKKTAFRFLLFLFLAAVFAWLFYTPRQSRTLLFAIPEDARLVTIHQDIAGRYNALLENPFTASLLNSAGLPLDELRRQLHEPAHARIIDFLLSGECTFSYVPPTMYNRSDMWIFTDWLGGRTTLLQIALNWGVVPYVDYFETYNAVPVYRLRLNQKEVPLFLAIVEGGIIGCICSDPIGIHRVVDGYLLHEQRILRQYNQLFNDPTISASAVDKGWYRPEDSTNCMSFTVSCLLSNRFDATLRFPSKHRGMPDIMTGSNVSMTERRFFGALPCLAINTTTFEAADILQKLMSPKWIPATDAAKNLLQNIPLSLVLIGDEEYSGRFFRMKFPSLFLTFSLPDTVDAEEIINKYIDQFNALYRAGLVPEIVPVSGGRKVCVIEGTTSEDYAKKPFDERIAYTIVSNRIIISTAAEALIKLTARYDRQEAVADIPQAVWPDMIGGQAPATASLWLDFIKGGKSIRLAIAAYAISLMQSSSENAATARMLIADAEAWTAALEPMQKLTAAYRIENGRGIIEIHAGP